jgi:hypothetical protein
MTAPSPILERVRSSCIVRLSGLPANAVDVLRSDALRTALDRISSIRGQLAAGRDALSQSLHDAVAVASSKPARNLLLAVRRDLFNGKLPSDARLVSARATLQGDAARHLDQYCDTLRELQRARTALDDVLLLETTRTRQAFRQALGDADFLKGLLSSSQSLFQNVTRYRRADASTGGSRHEQIERGLLRYFTRASMKATPFATFCGIAPGEFVEGQEGSPRLVGSSAAKHGFVRLN